MARNAITIAPAAAAQASQVGEGYWQIAWRRLRKHHLAMGGLVVIFLLIVSAVFAPWIAPYRFEEIDLMNRFAPPFRGLHVFGTDDVTNLNLDSIFKSRDITLPTKVCLVKT